MKDPFAKNKKFLNIKIIFIIIFIILILTLIMTFILVYVIPYFYERNGINGEIYSCIKHEDCDPHGRNMGCENAYSKPFGQGSLSLCYPPPWYFCSFSKCRQPKNASEWIRACKARGEYPAMEEVCQESAIYYLKSEGATRKERFKLCDAFENTSHELELCKIDVCTRDDNNCLKKAVSKDYSCKDNIKNGPESDVDCGGLKECQLCDNGKQCVTNQDCKSQACARIFQKGYFCGELCHDGQIMTNDRPCVCYNSEKKGKDPRYSEFYENPKLEPRAYYCCSGFKKGYNSKNGIPCGPNKVMEYD